MQVKGTYDLIVVGDQLSGLFLAAGAAQLGKRVLVLEGNSTPTVLYEVPSGRLMGDLLVEPVIGLQDGSKVDKFLKSLGLYQELNDLFPRHDPALQIVSDRLRFDFEYDLARLRETAHREFPLPEAKLEAFCRALTAQSVSKKSFSDVIADIPLPVEWENFGWLQTMLFGAMAPGALPYAAYKEVIELAARGIRYPVGGRSALKERLLGRILVFGGSIKKSTWVEEIVFERGRLSGVLLSSYEGFVRSPIVVGAMGAKTFYELVPKKYRPKALAAAVERIQPCHWRMSFTLLVPDGLIPEGMGSHVAVVDFDGPLAAERFLHINVFGKEVYGGIPAGHKALVVRILVPYEEQSLTLRYQERLLKRALKRLGEVMPFLRDQALALFPDPSRLEQDLVYQKFYHFKGLEFIPSALLAYESTLTPGYDNREFLDWKSYGLEGLLLCSRDIRPLLGFTGEVFTAMDLLANLQRKENLK
jgi:phytoene dehydrogenase-like protein